MGCGSRHYFYCFTCSIRPAFCIGSRASHSCNSSAAQLPPSDRCYGEMQLNDAMSSLRSFSLCGDLLWVGTGVHHILRTLITTSQGASSVAIAASLSEGHTCRFAASVMYEMTNLLGVPRNLSPSLDQRCKYTQMCSGIFNSTTFSRWIKQFAKLLYGSTITGYHRSWRLELQRFESKRAG